MLNDEQMNAGTLTDGERYFFNLKWDGIVISDRVGDELRNLRSAKHRARALAKALRQTAMVSQCPSAELELADREGRVIAQFALR